MSDAHIKNPVEWSGAALAQAGRSFGATLQALHGNDLPEETAHYKVRQIDLDDLAAALRQGYADFTAYRTDVAFLCLVYAVAGLVIAGLTLGSGLIPMLFPLASGFAILGPLFGVGLYEMSKAREQGRKASWTNAADVLGEKGFANIALLGLILIAVFLAWLLAAYLLYRATFGPHMPADSIAFVNAVLSTPQGTTLILSGVGVGFLFAVFALALGIVSFPLLLDDGRVGIATAVGTSFRAVAANPLTMAIWGLIIAGGLVLGSLPLFLGLIVILPVFGHATWHLYRRMVVRT